MTEVRKRPTLLVRCLVAGFVVSAFAGCGGAAHTSASRGGTTPPNGDRTKLTGSYLPDALEGQVWPGLRVYRTGNVYDAYTDQMPPDWRSLNGGPYNEVDICASILGDLIGVHGMSPGDAIINVYNASGSLAAGTGGDGKCQTM